MRSPRTRIAALLISLALLGAVPAASVEATPQAGVQGLAAKSCGSGYTHAVINGSHKCLRRGQFCSHSADSQYHRYGYHCHKRDRNGSYHLT